MLPILKRVLSSQTFVIFKCLIKSVQYHLKEDVMTFIDFIVKH